MINVFKKFQALLPSERLIIATVQSHNADGTSTLLTLDGNQLIARGQVVAVSQKAFVRGGVVEGAAPNLSTFNLTV